MTDKKIPYLSQKKFIELAKKAVAKMGPDYIYRPPGGYGCVYFDEEGEPSCILGHIISDLGITSENVGNHNSKTCDKIIGSKNDSPWRGKIMVHASPRVQVALRDLQRKQDMGVPWGRALEEALKHSNLK